jgi:hypothetical protein
MKEKFIDKAFSTKSIALINKASVILDEYQAQGYTLSLRQLYYQLVARNIVPNTVKSYGMVGNVISDARLAGLLDWRMIEDRGREVHTPITWRSPSEIVYAAARQFKIDHWRNQSRYVEVMCEKDALSGVILPVCRELGVRFTANKGYSSSTALYEAGKRIAHQVVQMRKEIHVIYYGDHDPSGIDMTRDIRERLSLFSGVPSWINMARLALNYDQVETYQPPENPAKTTDSRYESYSAEFGDLSWELDALEPKILADLLRVYVLSLIDKDEWERTHKTERSMIAELNEFADSFD